MYEFGRGDRIRVIGGIYEGSGGTIVENNFQGDDEFSRYGVLLDGERHIRLFYNHCLEPENLLDCKIDESDDFDESETISNVYNEREPKFQIGDVVEDIQDVSQSLSNPLYVIKEAITLVDNDLPVGYSYEVAPINSPDGSIIINEDALLFQYHDSNWSEYFIEGTRQNGLPAWREELYNFYTLNAVQWDDYSNCTIPPAFMDHILEDHYMAKKMGNVIKDHKSIIERAMDLNDNDLSKMRKSIIEKVESLNLVDTDILHPGRLARKANIEFTSDEYKLADIVAEVDRKKDYYPLKMTSLQVMQAIREAYEGAYKTNKRAYRIERDGETGEESGLKKGQRQYRGYSKTYDLLIEFWFNIDLKVIAIAYPVNTKGEC